LIAVCGEALIDLVDEGDGLFRAHPGGSPANVAVAPNRSALAALDAETLPTVIDEAALVAAITCSRRGPDSPTRDQVTAYGRNRSTRSDTSPWRAAGPLARAE
jgi:fructokinase